MRRGWKVGCMICTVASIAERIEPNHRGEHISRKPTDGNDRWAWRRWKTSWFSKPWRPSSTRFMRKTLWDSPMVPTGTQPASGAGCADGSAEDEEGELC